MGDHLTRSGVGQERQIYQGSRPGGKVWAGFRTLFHLSHSAVPTLAKTWKFGDQDSTIDRDEPPAAHPRP